MHRIAPILAGSLLSAFALAQTPIVFQPAAGSNDGTDEGGLNGGKDVWVYDGDPAMNYGANEICYSMPLTSCNFTNVRGFLKFDVSTLPALVDSVLLAVDFVEQTAYCYSNCAATFSFNYVDAPWNEMTMTWNDQPAPGAAFAGPFPVAFPETGGERHYDITDAYNAWRSGTQANHGFAIVPLDGSCNNAAVFFGFYSSDDTTAAHASARLLVYENTIGIPEHPDWNGLLIHPNPATDIAILVVPEAIGAVRVELLDASGRVVMRQGPIAAQRIAVPLGGFEAGSYSVRITSDRRGTAMRRVMKP